MKTDTYIKFILTIIALCLFALVFGNPPIIKNAVAASVLNCTGEIKANSWGGTEASIGGYKVNVTCK